MKVLKPDKNIHDLFTVLEKQTNLCYVAKMVRMSSRESYCIVYTHPAARGRGGGRRAGWREGDWKESGVLMATYSEW